MAAIQLFDPIGVLNDIIAGVFIGIKTVIKEVAIYFTGGPNFKYNKCKDAGEGIFGYRRKRDDNGNLIVGADKNVKGRVCKNLIVNLTIMVLCPPLAIYSPWNKGLVSYYCMCLSYHKTLLFSRIILCHNDMIC